MKEPPDPVWDDVMRQVKEAFGALDLGGVAIDDELLDQVRTALDAAVKAFPEGSIRPEAVSVEASIVPEPTGAPRVVVLPGGRDDDAPPEATGRPPLRVAEPHDAPEEPARERRVRVVRVSPREPAPSVHVAPLAMEGSIEAHAGDAGWQTLFRGQSARTYRLAATEGVLEVALDGELLEQVHPGQTTDVEARLIRVRATEGVARGRYARLG